MFIIILFIYSIDKNQTPHTITSNISQIEIETWGNSIDIFVIENLIKAECRAGRNLSQANLVLLSLSLQIF